MNSENSLQQYMLQRSLLHHYNHMSKNYPNIDTKLAIYPANPQSDYFFEPAMQQHAIMVKWKFNETGCRQTTCLDIYPRGKKCEPTTETLLFRSGNDVHIACQPMCKQNAAQNLPNTSQRWCVQTQKCIMEDLSYLQWGFDDSSRGMGIQPRINTIGTGFDSEIVVAPNHRDSYRRFKLNKYYCDALGLLLDEERGECIESSGQYWTSALISDMGWEVGNIGYDKAVNGTPTDGVTVHKSLPPLPAIETVVPKHLRDTDAWKAYDAKVPLIDPNITLDQLGFTVDNWHTMIWVNDKVDLETGRRVCGLVPRPVNFPYEPQHFFEKAILGDWVIPNADTDGDTTSNKASDKAIDKANKNGNENGDKASENGNENGDKASENGNGDEKNGNENGNENGNGDEKNGNENGDKNGNENGDKDGKEPKRKRQKKEERASIKEIWNGMVQGVFSMEGLKLMAASTLFDSSLSLLKRESRRLATTLGPRLTAALVKSKLSSAALLNGRNRSMVLAQRQLLGSGLKMLARRQFTTLLMGQVAKVTATTVSQTIPVLGQILFVLSLIDFVMVFADPFNESSRLNQRQLDQMAVDMMRRNFRQLHSKSPEYSPFLFSITRQHQHPDFVMENALFELQHCLLYAEQLNPIDPKPNPSKSNPSKSNPSKSKSIKKKQQQQQQKINWTVLFNVSLSIFVIWFFIRLVF